MPRNRRRGPPTEPESAPPVAANAPEAPEAVASAKSPATPDALPPAESSAPSESLVGVSEQGELVPAPPPEASAEEEALDAAEPELAPTHPGPARTAPRSVSELHLKSILESLVFVSDKPLTAGDLGRIARAETRDVRRLLEELREEYRGRGVQLDEVAGGWQFRSSVANAPFVREFLQAKPVRLTRAQVETLAIIAYRQPITRPEVDEIRGVDSGSAIKLLLERELLRMLGRKEEVGRPVLYGTTSHFLEFFGLKSLRDLPTLREFTDLSPESEATLVRTLGEGTPPPLPDAPPPAPDGPAPEAHGAGEAGEAAGSGDAETVGVDEGAAAPESGPADAVDDEANRVDEAAAESDAPSDDD